MKKAGISLALAALLALPAVAVAAPPESADRDGPPESADRAGPPEGAGPGGEQGSPARSYGEPRGERGQQRAAAARDRVLIVKACKAERGQTKATVAAFRTEYGTNENGANAFGVCVSSRMKEGAPQNAEELRQLVGEIRARKVSARACVAELREMGRQDFADRYGTNRNLRNAYGKCVSGKASERAPSTDPEA